MPCQLEGKAEILEDWLRGIGGRSLQLRGI